MRDLAKCLLIAGLLISILDVVIIKFEDRKKPVALPAYYNGFLPWGGHNEPLKFCNADASGVLTLPKGLLTWKWTGDCWSVVVVKDN